VITVSNTTPIISLSSIGKIELLKEIFQEVIIPEAVYDEIKAKQGYGYHEIDLEFISVQSVKNIKEPNSSLYALDIGEIETILLSQELNADNTLIDEKIGFKTAKKSGLNAIRTLSILLKAKELDIVTEVKPLIIEMVSKGRWYSNNVYNQFLKKAGEL